MAFKRADIVLPVFADDSEKMKRWSVVACDQYTSEPRYWNEVADFVGEAPSTLNLTVPEIYLNDADIEERIQKTNKNIAQSAQNGIFNEYKNVYILVERTLRNGAKRLGIVGMVDLEEYDFSPDSVSKVRATEGTVISRIPPRLKVRKDAPVEFPHIMLLIDDVSATIIEGAARNKEGYKKVYDFDLMQNSGHITGYILSQEAADLLDEQLLALASLEDFNKKYGVQKSSPLVYAMGDGNHSLATAKTSYENLKKEIGDEAARVSPARYALCELVNLHDSSLVFEAIHRVVFNADADAFINHLQKEYALSFDEDVPGQSFLLVKEGKTTKVIIKNPRDYLTVATVQKALDAFIKGSESEIDYIHGEDVTLSLSHGNNFGILFDAMSKNDLFKSVIVDGALPRKTFSMGDACDKRFYTEGRKIK